MWLEPGTDKDARAAVEALTPAKSSGPKPTCRSFKLCSRSPARARRRQTWRCCWTRRASLYAGRSSVRACPPLQRRRGLVSPEQTSSQTATP